MVVGSASAAAAGVTAATTVVVGEGLWLAHCGARVCSQLRSELRAVCFDHAGAVDEVGRSEVRDDDGQTSSFD